MLKDRSQIEAIGATIQDRIHELKMTKAAINSKSRVYRPVIDKVIKGEDYNITSLVAIADALDLVLTLKPKRQ